MNRASFVRRSLLAVGALSLGRLPAAPAPALALPQELELVDGGVLEFGVIRDSVLVASGGLCAPLKPTYEIVVDALPTFRADRGGITFRGKSA